MPKNSAFARIGNKNKVSLKSTDVRQEAYRQYCAHLAAGYPKEAFFFDHPEHSCCFKTIERYIRESPGEFPPILRERAYALRYKFWLDKGRALIDGTIRYGSPVVWQTMMRNMFRDLAWDVIDTKQSYYTEEQRQTIDRLFAELSKLRETATKQPTQSDQP